MCFQIFDMNSDPQSLVQTAGVLVPTFRLLLPALTEGGKCRRIVLVKAPVNHLYQLVELIQ